MTVMADSLCISEISNKRERTKNQTQFCNGRKKNEINPRIGIPFDLSVSFIFFGFYTLNTYISLGMLHRTLGWAMWLNFSDRNALFKNIVCVLLRCAYTVLYLFMCVYEDNKMYVCAYGCMCVYWIDNTDSCILFIVATSAFAVAAAACIAVRRCICCCDEVTKSEPVNYTESFFLLPLYFINSF